MLADAEAGQLARFALEKKLTRYCPSKFITAVNRPCKGQQIGIKTYEMVEAAGVEPASAGSPLLALHA